MTIAASSKSSAVLANSSVDSVRDPDTIPPSIFDEVPDDIIALGCTSQPADSAFATPEPKKTTKSPAHDKSGEQMGRAAHASPRQQPTPAQAVEPPTHVPADEAVPTPVPKPAPKKKTEPKPAEDEITAGDEYD
eukprot:6151756-Pyramimonas_sp.AAC.1